MAFEDEVMKRVNDLETKVADIANKVGVAVDKEADKVVVKAANWLTASKYTAVFLLGGGLVFLWFVFN
jgi:hypothetical protein